MKFAQRLDVQKNIHWHTVRELVQQKQAEGVDVIRLASGDPDLPTPAPVVETLRESILDPTYHRYPFSIQTNINTAIADWYARRFKVTLDPSSEVLPLAGSLEGIGLLSLATIEPGTVAIVPDPAFGSYARSAQFAGGDVHYVPLTEENHFLPDLAAIPSDVAAKARLLWISYPHNPTGAIAPLSVFEDVIAFAKANDIIVCHDNAYADITYDGYVAPSFLAVDGAKEVGIELNTFSKGYNMAGWRVGLAVGNAEVIKALSQTTSTTSMGLFGPVQLAAIEALSLDQHWIDERNAIYQRRRDMVVDGLRAAGLEPIVPKATLYVWTKLPAGYRDSFAFSKMMLEQTGVWISSGVFFGPAGEGYLRATLTLPDDTLREAMERLKRLKL
ncbi:MAG: aminotransferase class I/II-fold pyridoxal phosphate-dependent enzyme [Chloroflexota bacterium]